VAVATGRTAAWAEAEKEKIENKNIFSSRVADPDPDSIRSVDPDSGSGSRRAKMTHKSNFFLNFMFLSVGWPLLRAEGFFLNLDVLYGGLGIGKL
jgi:hypothetical protein